MPPVAAPAAPTTAAVSLANSAFAPASVTIAVGGTVTWTNNDTMPHNVTSNDGAFPASPTLNAGQVFSHTFTTAGTFGYNCTFHGGMTGTVIVQAADGSVPPPAPGAGAPAPAPGAAAPAPGAPAPAPPPGTPAPATASVSLANSAFAPASVTIAVGGTVTWTNNDTMPHNVTSNDGAFPASPTLNAGQVFSHTFTTAGTFGYNCTFHSGMTATVIVQAANGTVPPPAPGAAAPAPGAATAPAPAAAPAVPATPGKAGTHTVTVTDAGYTPATLQARAGDTVTFVNTGKMPHTATVAGGFDLIMAAGASASTVLQKPGTLNYVCTYHSYMKGSIVVSAALPGVTVAPPATAAKPPVVGAGKAAPAVPAKPGQPGKHTVTVSDAGYTPATLQARAGDTVTWVNNGALPHTATVAGGFDLIMAPGASASTVLQKPGTLNYVCTYHSYMKGSIVVSAALPGVKVAPAGPAKAGTGTKPPTTTASAPGSAAPAPAEGGKTKTYSVQVKDNTFSPSTVNARVGDTISWVNVGKMPHTVTAQDKSFDKVLAPGERYSYALRAEGTVAYVCTYHPGMDGTIVVGAALAGVAVPPPSASSGGSGGNSASSAATGATKPVAAAPAAGTAKAKTHEIKVNEMTFSPATLNARVGDTVSWVNVGKIPHTVTAQNKSFDKVLAPGERYNLVLTKEGSIPYVCTYHPGMDGSLTVGPALAGAAAGAAPATGSKSAPAAPVSTGTTKTHEVQVKDSSFNPATLDARVGDTISWVNLGKMPHSVTAIDRSFDQMLAPGQRFNLVLRKQGTIQYICTPHPSMFGTINVGAALGDATAAAAVTPVSNISPVAVAGLSTGWLLIIILLTATQLRARMTAGAAAALRRRIPATSPAGRQP